MKKHAAICRSWRYNQTVMRGGLGLLGLLWKGTYDYVMVWNNNDDMLSIDSNGGVTL